MSEQTVRWSHLRPDDFKKRQSDCPVVLLPIGLCEPHGHVAALGLDTLKADYYCEEAARISGGIVAPTQGYHIHECGFHAPWLEEVVGEENPLMGGMPPHVICHHFLYQLRIFANAGFQSVIVVSGHSGGSQDDLRRVAEAFSGRFGINVTIKTDPEWVEGLYTGDHAGSYEISQLMAISPELVDLSLLDRRHDAGSGGQLALGDDASESSIERGREINEAIVTAICRHIDVCKQGPGSALGDYGSNPIDYSSVEELWRKLEADPGGWRSNRPHEGQRSVSSGSRWAPYEHLA